MNTLITATVGRNSRITRKALLATTLAVNMEENNRRKSAKDAAHIAEMKSQGLSWHNTPRIQK